MSHGTDPREQALNDAARRIMVESNYDPHFSAIGERLIMETKLFLARWDALQRWIADRDRVDLSDVPEASEEWFKRARVILPPPIPMILFCPNCGVQHIDAPEPHKPNCNMPQTDVICTCDAWQNPPHKSHLCHYCGWIWRPADVPTTGVAELQTAGKNDSQGVVRGVIDKTARFLPQWRHKTSGVLCTEIGRGELLGSLSFNSQRSNRVVAYKGEDNELRFRLESEFDDGRFEQVKK